MKKYSTIYWLVSFIVLMAISSCKKFVEIDLPRDELTTKKVFADSSGANAALAGIYVNMNDGGFLSGYMTIYPGMSSDELYQPVSDENAQFFNNSLLPANYYVDVLWTAAYAHIYTANACIEGIENSTSLTDTQKSVFIGEARCIRALIYFNLVNLYGPIPLVLTTDHNHTRTLPRVSEDKIYRQIIEDLIYAKSVLPLSIERNVRVNKDVATALLARMYLYQRDYNAAIAEATESIESDRYTLAATPNEVFLPQSKETIWGLLPVFPGFATMEGYYFIPYSSTIIPSYIITNTLLNAFEANDLRKAQWIGFNTDNGEQYPYPHKYKILFDEGTEIPENYVMLRLAEQYLIRSEAHAHLGDLTAAEADINKIRQRAGLPDFSANNDETMMLREIEKQRQLEFAFEWGHRWFDLKRTGRINEVLQAVKPDWNPTDELYPIPKTQMERNPFLIQNDGYN